MREITIQQLQENAGQWVKLAESEEPVIITEDGKPVAILSSVEEARQTAGRLPDREERIKLRTYTSTDSADYISEMRG